MTTPAPDLATPAGPPCGTCGTPAAVHWQRRLTTDEIAAQQKIEQDRRNDTLVLADPQLPAPVFPPMPDFLDATTTIYGCAQHAITLDQAVHTHTAGCTAPPCNCTPEPLPKPAPEPPSVELPPGW